VVTTTNGFGIATSPNGINWTYYGDISFNSADADQWCPEWFIDPTNGLHLLGLIGGAVEICDVSASNLTNAVNLRVITNNVGTDEFIVSTNGLFYLFMSSGEFVSSSLDSNYVRMNSNSTGFSSIEGSTVFFFAGQWWWWKSQDEDNTVNYATSIDLTNWTAWSVFPSPQVPPGFVGSFGQGTVFFQGNNNSSFQVGLQAQTQAQNASTNLGNDVPAVMSNPQNRFTGNFTGNFSNGFDITNLSLANLGNLFFTNSLPTTTNILSLGNLASAQLAIYGQPSAFYICITNDARSGLAAGTMFPVGTGARVTNSAGTIFYSTYSWTQTNVLCLWPGVSSLNPSNFFVAVPNAAGFSNVTALENFEVVAQTPTIARNFSAPVMSDSNGSGLMELTPAGGDSPTIFTFYQDSNNDPASTNSPNWLIVQSGAANTYSDSGGSYFFGTVGRIVNGTLLTSPVSNVAKSGATP
ncbi:MAG: hypothetical protein ABSD57_04550, partial [Verrucomicrobiota bacterium]